jgi:hypothetical protein
VTLGQIRSSEETGWASADDQNLDFFRHATDFTGLRMIIPNYP